MSFSILILCSDGPHHGYLVQKLSCYFAIDCVFCEPEAAQQIRLLKGHRYRDYLWRRYHNFRRRVLGLSRYRCDFFGGEFEVLAEGKAKIRKVKNINNPEVATHAMYYKPNMIVVMGTTILKGDILQLGIPIVNIHGGYLPDYKGNHCMFFAYLNGELNKVGSTIHLIDSGVDSGAIIERVSVSVLPGDVPESSYCKAEKKAVNRIISFLKNFEVSGAFSTFQQSEVGRMYRTRDRKLKHDLVLWRRIGRLIPADYQEITSSVRQNNTE